MKRARLPFSLVVNLSIITNLSTTPNAAFNIECSTMPRNLKTSRIILPKQIASNGIDHTAVVQILGFAIDRDTRELWRNGNALKMR
jgi:hypothetical protein